MKELIQLRKLPGERTVELWCNNQILNMLSRYLNFARMFKPKLSMDSQELLVQQYKHLRQRDTGGSAKSSWRITVRQLESMLRLSESFARLHCSEEVTAKHVKEAYRLLNKSIIR